MISLLNHLYKSHLDKERKLVVEMISIENQKNSAVADYLLLYFQDVF